MKYSFFALALVAALCSQTSRAEEATACGKQIICGTYSGEGVGRDAKGEEVELYNEKLVLSSSAENTAKMVITITGKAPEEQIYDLDMVFNADGTLDMFSKGYPYASGMCGLGVCTYGMVPFGAPDAPAVANAGSIRFTKAGLERNMLVTDADGLYVQISTLKRQ